MARGVDKGAAVRRVCNHLGLAPARALAFGDGWNDLEMLEAVGLPCVMENAPEGLRVYSGLGPFLLRGCAPL